MKKIVNYRVLKAHKTKVASLLLGGMIVAGCRATAAPDSGYLADSSDMSRVARSPFERSWFDHQIDPAKYTELLVRPVNMQYVAAENIWEKANIRSETTLKEDFATIAKYTQDAFIKAANEDPKHKFKIVDTAGPNTAVLEMAIVQLVPSKAILNMASNIDPIAGGSVMALELAGGDLTNSQDQGEGVIAIEGRIRDGATGQVIYMFSDRERGQLAALNLAEYTWWEPEKRIIDIWATDLIKLASTPENQKVKQPATFTLMLW